MDNMTIYDKLKITPQEAQKTIGGGRLKGFTDINPQYRIRALTEQFGPCGIGWYYTPDKKWTETAGDEILCFVDISLYIKVDGEWSKPISGTGGSSIYAKEKAGMYASDEGYKMATTDAISVAAKQLGIGADIYWQKGETKYAEKTFVKAPSRQDTITDFCVDTNITLTQFRDKMAALQAEGKVVSKKTALMSVDEFQAMMALMSA